MGIDQMLSKARGLSPGSQSHPRRGYARVVRPRMRDCDIVQMS
jgi:hypothetical protein